MMRPLLAFSVRCSCLVAAAFMVGSLLSCAAGEPIEGNLTPTPDVVSMQLLPDIISVAADASTAFSVSVELSDGSIIAAPAIFSTTGGTIDSIGRYTAPHPAGVYQVVARSLGFADTSVVTVEGNGSPDLIRLSIDPGSAALLPGGTQRFTTNGIFSDSSIVPLTVNYASTGGSVSGTGFYTAGQTLGLFRVVASLKGGELADTAVVEITQPPTNLVRVELTPPSAALAFGQSFQFSAAGRLSDSTLVSIPITWTATGGTVSSSGVYTAGTNAGNFRVIARASGGLADTSTISISAPVVASLRLTPKIADLQVGQIQQYTVTATLSNGAVQNNPTVTYTFTGGLMTQGGLYTAGLLPGTYQVIARASSGAADTGTVNITLAILSALNIAPTTATVQTGQTMQFGATARLSNGGTQANPDVTWTATGGTVSSTGLFTAGSTPGSFQVRVTSVVSLLSGTASVNVVAAPPASMFFNSSEAGCGSDSNVVLCDDFEDGDWYAKDCDQANGSGGLLQTDGWCGNIYDNPITPAKAAVCGNQGYRSNCAATQGETDGEAGGRNMADHSLSTPVKDMYVRFYTKPMAGYKFGAEKLLTVNKDEAGVGGIYWGNLHINCGAGGAGSSGTLMWQPVPPAPDGCRDIFTMQAGRWTFIELHMNVATGVLQVWADDCGDGTGCTGTPTLRLNLTGWKYPSSTNSIESLWWENWASPGSIGTRLIDQIKVSKVGPIGFMP